MNFILAVGRESITVHFCRPWRVCCRQVGLAVLWIYVDVGLWHDVVVEIVWWVMGGLCWFTFVSSRVS